MLTFQRKRVVADTSATCEASGWYKIVWLEADAKGSGLRFLNDAKKTMGRMELSYQLSTNHDDLSPHVTTLIVDWRATTHNSLFYMEDLS